MAPGGVVAKEASKGPKDQAAPSKAPKQKEATAPAPKAAQKLWHVITSKCWQIILQEGCAEWVFYWCKHLFTCMLYIQVILSVYLYIYTYWCFFVCTRKLYIRFYFTQVYHTENIYDIHVRVCDMSGRCFRAAWWAHRSLCPAFLKHCMCFLRFVEMCSGTQMFMSM